MIAPTDAVKTWLESDPNWAAYGFELQQGQWQDTPANAKKRLCFLTSTGGRLAALPEVTYDTVEVWLLGPQKGGSDMVFIRNLAYALRARLVEDSRVDCVVVQLRLQAAPQGPYFTTEQRPYMRLNFELLC